MVRCAFHFARLQIYVANLAAVRQWRSCKNVIYAPPEIALKRVSKEIPVRILHALRMKLSKDVDEPPTGRLFVGGSRVDVEIYIVYPPVRVIDVDRLGSDI